MWMSAFGLLPRQDQGQRGANRSPAKQLGGQLLAQRLVLSRGQSPEVLDWVLRPEQPVEPRPVFCEDSSDRMSWMLDNSVMLRTASVRRGTTQWAGDRETPIPRHVEKGFAHFDRT
jgi:hypothetical protein